MRLFGQGGGVYGFWISGLRAGGSGAFWYVDLDWRFFSFSFLVIRLVG